MKRLFLFLITTLVVTFNVTAQSSNNILLQCSSLDKTRLFSDEKTILVLISIDKKNQEANVEYRVGGVVKENVESLPVEFTENTITITEEYSTEKLTKNKFPEGMDFTTQMRISRKTLSMKTYGRFNDAGFEHIKSGESVCELIQTDKLGNQI